MNRIRLKAGDILESNVGNGIKGKGRVLFVEKTSLIRIKFEGHNANSLRNCTFPTDFHCIDIYLEPKMGWERVASIGLGSTTNELGARKKCLSLSKILFDCRVYCSVFPSEKNSFFETLKTQFWPFRKGIFCDILDEESCLRIGKEKIQFDSPEWKEVLSSGNTIHFEDPCYDKYLGNIKKVWKGFVYEFDQGDQKSLYINEDYVTWPMIDHYWNYYGGILRPEMFHKSIPPW